ncbi:MAG: phage integrase N-terminal SAM-like domain-containing protein [Desulforhopalus sp.]
MSDQFPQNTQSSVPVFYNGYETFTSHFSTYLRDCGYRDGTRHAYCSALSHYLRWHTKKSPRRQTINKVTLDAFLKHLPGCRCLPSVFKEYKTVRAALNNLLVLLGEDRLSPCTAKIPPAIREILREFDDFQRDVCGVTESTRFYRHRFVRSFLVWLSVNQPGPY